MWPALSCARDTVLQKNHWLIDREKVGYVVKPMFRAEQGGDRYHDVFKRPSLSKKIDSSICILVFDFECTRL